MTHKLFLQYRGQVTEDYAKALKRIPCTVNITIRKMKTVISPLSNVLFCCATAASLLNRAPSAPCAPARHTIKITRLLLNLARQNAPSCAIARQLTLITLSNQQNGEAIVKMLFSFMHRMTNHFWHILILYEYPLTFNINRICNF